MPSNKKKNEKDETPEVRIIGSLGDNENIGLILGDFKGKKEIKRSFKFKLKEIKREENGKISAIEFESNDQYFRFNLTITRLFRQDAKTELLKMLSNKQIIMGFGHAVYKELDPRTAVIKQFSKQLSDTVADPTLYDVSCEVERIMKEEKGMFANADFYHASAYNFMEIPTELFTPIFVCSRLVGWCAHIMEQRENNRLIRPTAEYNGVEKAVWVDLQNR